MRRNKRIELIRLEYSQKYLFDKSYLIVKYRFKNALWYNFHPILRTTEKEVTVINLQAVETSVITLYVRGFFKSKNYLLNIEQEYYLNNRGFETVITNIKSLVNSSPSIDISITNPTLHISEVSVKTDEKTVIRHPYIQSDFI